MYSFTNEQHHSLNSLSSNFYSIRKFSGKKEDCGGIKIFAIFYKQKNKITKK
jgi:hypothetical protein